MLKFCGPKLSLCCSVISVWGIIQLILMGILFKAKAPAFLEDLNIPKEAHHDADVFIKALDKSYAEIGTNCFIAVGCYCATLIISGWQWWENMNVPEEYNYQTK